MGICKSRWLHLQQISASSSPPPPAQSFVTFATVSEPYVTAGLYKPWLWGLLLLHRHKSLLTLKSIHPLLSAPFSLLLMFGPRYLNSLTFQSLLLVAWRKQTLLFPNPSINSSGRMSRFSSASWEMWSVQRVLGVPQDLLLDECFLNSYQGDVQQASWPDVCSTAMTVLHPAELQRKHIGAPSTCDLISGLWLNCLVLLLKIYGCMFYFWFTD